MISIFNFTSLPSLSLYIHFPWCVRKCPYCDFNSHALKTDLPEAAYIDALVSDLEQELPLIWGRPISSIFLGGGTPSLFSPEALDRLFSSLRARLAFTPDIEITLEANPGAIEQERFNEYRAIGINRLSIGVQSFNDDHLEKLGRIHNCRDAYNAAEAAHAAGLDNFNLDLMFALPQQTLAQSLSDLDEAITLEPTHISWYQLTIEPNTLFHRQLPTLPSDDQSWEMQQQGREKLATAGYTQYEVSAYTRGAQCRHNLNYWHFGDYIGIGAGAHGKISRADTQTISRRWKIKQPAAYLQDADNEKRLGGLQMLSEKDASLEFMMNALRLQQGFPSALFMQHTGLALNTVEQPLREAEELGWIQWRKDQIIPTENGQRFLNNLLGLFLTD
ncbi:Radical SAM family enzyme, similar to coproporphyrinogen III oxidase, oxygen-independent, clustered with nucleoside-triphosphatase RdgB [hydrothermal vent metagenome]|uniref:Radical SAM family enzyme, similar to coproporphyrinogen III oxidase, oxygen-independent, clustered with nucleoside-triphosphatase RdgB n=1 Tax=hydrothermal vent metagenome TaxID=652676 RepID=A0A3B1BMJ0_9ZZZZ